MQHHLPSVTLLALLSSCGSATDSSTEVTCDYDGTTYDLGDSFPAGDGCNTCSCTDEGLGCTEMGCESGCTDNDGGFHGVGDSWKSDCNTCTCHKAGSWDCTDLGCL